MVSFIVLVQPHLSNLGIKTFQTAPQIGEYISLDDASNTAQIYKVNYVIHAPASEPTKSNLVVQHKSTGAQLLHGLMVSAP